MKREKEKKKLLGNMKRQQLKYKRRARAHSRVEPQPDKLITGAMLFHRIGLHQFQDVALRLKSSKQQPL